jgi:hypothetical protein
VHFQTSVDRGVRNPGGSTLDGSTMMTKQTERVRAIQSSMLESGSACFLDSELEALRCLIRLTVEFADYLDAGDTPPYDKHGLRYVLDSVFSGMESFYSVTEAYGVLAGAVESQLVWDTFLPRRLKEQFTSMYREFLVTADFTGRCRLLLDLFKLQIVFAAMLYD